MIGFIFFLQISIGTNNTLLITVNLSIKLKKSFVVERDMIQKLHFLYIQV